MFSIDANTLVLFGCQETADGAPLVDQAFPQANTSAIANNTSLVAFPVAGSGVGPGAQQWGPNSRVKSRGVNAIAGDGGTAGSPAYFNGFPPSVLSIGNSTNALLGPVTFEMVFSILPKSYPNNYSNVSLRGTVRDQTLFSIGHNGFESLVLSWTGSPRLRWKPVLVGSGGPGGQVSISVIQIAPWDTGWRYFAMRKTPTGGTGNFVVNTVELWCRELGQTWSDAPDVVETNVYNPGVGQNTMTIGGYVNPVGAAPADTTRAAYNLAGIRISKVARSNAELRDSFSSFKYGSSGDVTPPVVTIVSPTPGTGILRTQPITFDVTDETGFRRVMVLASFPSKGIYEVIHDGDRWGPHYDVSPNARTDIAGGHRFTVLRRGGWPAAPSILPMPIDVGGNEAA